MKTVKSILVALLFLSGVFVLSACQDFNIPGNEETPNPTVDIGGRAPVYQGMTISDVSTTNQTSAFNQLLSFVFNEQNETFDEEIEDVIEDYVDVITSDEIEYFSPRNQDILITVRLLNPDGQSILRFTLNGVIYQSFQFQDGSDSENLILKVNSGDVSGVKELTIDEIKYVENITNITKDAIFDGDRTIKLGVGYANIPQATVSDLNVTATSFSFNTNISDSDSLIEKSDNVIKAALFDGETIIEVIDLTLGQNDVKFDKLNINKAYQYAVFTVIDKLDGLGNQVLVMHQEYIQTEEILIIKDASTTQSLISFDLLVNDIDEVGSITAIELYQGEILIEALTDLSLRTFSDLLSNNEYQIKVTYTYDLNDGVGEQELIITEPVTTLAKVTPEVVLDNVVSTQDSVAFDIAVTDTDEVGSITSIELFQGEVLIQSLIDLSMRSFDSLNANSTYTIVVNYSYDLNDGNHFQTILKTVHVNTLFDPLNILSISNNSEVVLDGNLTSITILVENPNQFYILNLVVNNEIVSDFELNNTFNEISFQYRISSKGQEIYNIVVNQIDFIVGTEIFEGLYNGETNLQVPVIQKVVVETIKSSTNSSIFIIDEDFTGVSLLVDLHNPFNYEITKIGIKNSRNAFREPDIIEGDSLVFDNQGNLMITYHYSSTTMLNFYITSITYVVDDEEYTTTYESWVEASSEGLLISVIDDGEWIGINSINGLRNMTNGNKYILTADINLLNIPWEPLDIHYFVLNGNGYTISGINVQDSPRGETEDRFYYGLFGRIQSATIYNLKLNGNIDISVPIDINWSTIEAGLLFGHGYTVVLENIEVDGTVAVNGHQISVGMIFGVVYDAHLNNLSATGDLIITCDIGHINSGTIGGAVYFSNLKDSVLISDVDLVHRYIRSQRLVTEIIGNSEYLTLENTIFTGTITYIKIDKR